MNKPLTSQRLKHTVRHKDGGTIDLTITRTRAIKLMCTECMGWETNPNECTDALCPLFPYKGNTAATKYTR